MTTGYIIGRAVGYNLILIICCVLGILLAKKDNWGWLIYCIGVGYTAFALFGNITRYLNLLGRLPVTSTASLTAFIVIAINIIHKI